MEKRKNDETFFELEDKLTFGQYKGKVVKDIIERNPKYIRWCLQNIKWFKLEKETLEKYNECLRHVKSQRSSGSTYDPAPTMGDIVHGNMGPNGGWGNIF